jgi:acyl-coenzyme A synthetase/AMP-(fatty) acid ligase
MKPLDPGTLFDVLVARRSRTTVHLSRPLDIAPNSGVRYDVERLAKLVREAARWLSGAGVRAGDRVAIVKPNHWDYVLLACAAMRVGAVPALISDQLSPSAVTTLLDRLSPALLVTCASTLEAARAAGCDLAASATRTLTVDDPTDAALYVTDLRHHPEPKPVVRHDDDPLLICHTSGTTGMPKLVVHSTSTIIRRIAGFEALRWPLLASRRDDTVASAISFAHGRALAWSVSVLWLAPREMLIIDDGDPKRAELVLRAHPPTTLEALPSSLVRWQRLAEQDDNPFHQVRLYVSTFDAVHPPTVRAFLRASRRRFPLWMQGWGQSETGPLTFRFFTRRSLAKPVGRHPTTRALGRPVLGWVRLRVVDPETLRPVGRRDEGLVMARTRTRCVGYVGEPERWQAKVEGPWFNTGDLGRRTRTGALVLRDREVDMVPGMSCVEVEDLLHERLPEVTEAAVLSAAGQLPVPVLVTENGRLDEARWQAAVADLPPLAPPRVVGWDAVPRTGTGKVRRHALRDHLLAGVAGCGTGRWT